MPAASIGQNGQRIHVGDYVKIPASQLSITPGPGNAYTDYIGVCLMAGGQNIAGVYLTNSGATAPFANIAANQCQQIGQAGGPGNAGNTVGAN